MINKNNAPTTMNRNRPATIETARRLLQIAEAPTITKTAYRAWRKEAKALCNFASAQQPFDSVLVDILRKIAR